MWFGIDVQKCLLFSNTKPPLQTEVVTKSSKKLKRLKITMLHVKTGQKVGVLVSLLAR